MLSRIIEYLKAKRRNQRLKCGYAIESGRFFYEHAFFFLEHADEILSNPRMAFAEIPIRHSLAFVNASGLQRPLLCSYLEFWETCKGAVLHTKRGEELIWYIAGSPLSGRNHCSSVDRKGHSHRARLVTRFNAICSSFANINEKNRHACHSEKPYDIETVYKILATNEKDINSKH